MTTQSYRSLAPFLAAVRSGTLGMALCLGAPGWALAASMCADPSISTLPVLGLGTHNTLHRVLPGSPGQSSRVTGIDGNLIGIDVRPSDRKANAVYGIADTGKLYLIDVSALPYRASLISTVLPRFAGGYQALADFNPTGASNALRLIGSNDQNFALTGANLNQTVVQTPVAYVSGDPYVNGDPNITAGAYDSNLAGAQRTTFYMIDYDLDTFVTIADRNAGGSSNTAGGQLKTIGPLVDEQGNPLNFAPAAGLDIYTSPAGQNVGFAVTGQDLYCIDLAAVDPDQPVGALQKVVAERLPSYSQEIARSVNNGGLIDVAVLGAGPALVANQADLQVTASGSAGGVGGRVNVSYFVSVKNLGPATASTASLASTTLACSGLPGTVGGCSAAASQGSCTLNGLAGNLLSCNFGDLASGATATVRVGGGTFNLAPGGVTSTFTGLSNTPDANRDNNSASVTVVIPDSGSDLSNR